MIIPLGTPVQVADAVSVTAATTAPIATLELPLAATEFSVQLEIGEAINYPNTCGANLSSSLDQANYVIGLGGAGVNYTGPLTAGAYFSGFGQYLQVKAQNTDTIPHTFTVWVLAK